MNDSSSEKPLGLPSPSGIISGLVAQIEAAPIIISIDQISESAVLPFDVGSCGFIHMRGVVIA